MPNPPLRLANPVAKIPTDQRTKISATVDKNHADYLFRRVLPDMGSIQCCVATFVDKLYAECISRGIALRGQDDPKKAMWDEENESLVAQILNDLNFRPPYEPAQPKPTSKNKRRTDRPSVIPSAQQNADGNDTRRASRVRSGASSPGKPATNPNEQAPS